MTGPQPPESTLSLLSALGKGAASASLSRPASGPSGRVARDCGEFGIRIARDGTWYYQNSPIGRLPLVKLFASVLRREADGRYWLVTPAERGRIDVEDAPFLAVEVTVENQGAEQRLRFRTNLDEEVYADAAHPLRVATDPATSRPSPYVYIRDGMEARLTRAVYYELVGLGEMRRHEERSQLGILSAGIFFPLGTLDAE